MKSISRTVGKCIYWAAWPFFLIYFKLFPRRTRVLIINNERLLLVRGWLGDGKWILPGGGLHRHEKTVSGAVREVFEETNLKLQPEQLKSLGEAAVGEHGLNTTCIYFVAELDQAPNVSAKAEISDITWLELKQLDVTTLSKAVVVGLERYHSSLD